MFRLKRKHWCRHDVEYGGSGSEDVGGPTDSRKSSFRDVNNPVHGSPTHGSSRGHSPSANSAPVDVTAAIGMRVQQLEMSMNDQARVSRSRAILHPPMELTYGKKIGVGGFGAVYEGKWGEKTVRACFPGTFLQTFDTTGLLASPVFLL